MSQMPCIYLDMCRLKHRKGQHGHLDFYVDMRHLKQSVNGAGAQTVFSQRLNFRFKVHRTKCSFHREAGFIYKLLLLIWYQKVIVETRTWSRNTVSERRVKSVKWLVKSAAWRIRLISQFGSDQEIGSSLVQFDWGRRDKAQHSHYCHWLTVTPLIRAAGSFVLAVIEPEPVLPLFLFFFFFRLPEYHSGF